MERTITDSVPLTKHFKDIMWESMIKGEKRVILSVIRKYEPLAKQLIVTLRMYGMEMENLDKNPYEVITQGKNIPLTLIKYSLILNPMIISIRDELLKDPKAKNLLVYLLNNLEEDKTISDQIDSKMLEDQQMKKLLSALIELLNKSKDADATGTDKTHS